jgi:bifunctional UDP-N-acetylglucosamine pyrophosphorylase/glucosamine-1-phosphate N-acetyltransferase
MTQTSLTIIILGAGKGTRMRSSLPKIMHPIAGKPMIGHVLDTASQLNPDKIHVVLAPDMQQVQEYIAPHSYAIQSPAMGTGHALRCGLENLGQNHESGTIIVLLGDAPLIKAETLQAFYHHHQSTNAGISVLGMQMENPTGFGRLITDPDHAHILQDIVEEKDANPVQKQINQCNSGVFCLDAAKIQQWIKLLKNENAQGEYYITDLPKIARADGAICSLYVEKDSDQFQNVNSKMDLARAEALFQERLRQAHMKNGVTLQDPNTIYFHHDTKIGTDCSIGANVVFGANVQIANHVTIYPFCHLEGVVIKDNAQIGPFARVRPNSIIGEKVHIGNFVEVKNSDLHEGVKAGHLSYLGDSDIGQKTNIGAGTITCNYDGYQKHRTYIGADVFVGSNSTLIAPIRIENDAYIAAASVVTKPVPAGALYISRALAQIKEGWVQRFRAMKSRQK